MESMSFGEAIATCLRKYVVFRGRARRAEFWWFYLFTAAVAFVAAFVDALLFPGRVDSAVGYGPLTWMIILATFLPSLAVGARRLHDTDRAATWLLIGLVPVIGTIVLLVLYAQKGTPGPNRFGPAPGHERLGAEQYYSNDVTGL